jgi:AcrR family transcriptional regulator
LVSIVRKRLSHGESRAAALEAARGLLIEAGPQAVTLKAVAGRIGRTHANLLHHFGSAAGLQMALAETRRGEADPRLIVDMTFDAFDGQGAGALATWMILTGNENALNPILDAIHNLMEDLGKGHDFPLMNEDTLNLVLMAMGDALLGGPLAKALGVPRETAREIAYKQLMASPGVVARLAMA